MNLLNVIDFGEAMKYDDLFSDIKIPTGLDKQVLVDRIVFTNWDLTPRVTDFKLFKLMINNFFKTKESSYNRLYLALIEEYNPIHNYDRYEDRKENRKNIKNDDNVLDTSTEDEDTVSASNSSIYQPKTKQTGKLKSTDKRIINDNEDYTTENHLYGNIGVTTSQQMLESEIRLRIENNIYDLISLDFRREFMLLLM